MSESVGELVRRSETEYIRGGTHISKYVNFSMLETIDTITAYLNSKHTTGETDSLGRDKPFFNITVAAANIWFRATDIDTADIKIRATKSKDWLDAFLATVHVQEWMRRESFAVFLNEWGRVLSRYGSAVTKFVENRSGLHISVIPWSTLIVDSVDFEGNPKIEVLELTEAQLWGRVATNGYDADQVKNLCAAAKPRETLEKRRKDNRTGYIKVYEVHGNLSMSQYKKAKGIEPVEADDTIYFQQMQVLSFVGTKSGRETTYQDFTLYAGRERQNNYLITHLIKEDGRTLAIGAPEYLFQSQWMANHAKKTEKDALDIASRLIFQSADSRFVGKNVLDNIESGDILIYGMGNNMAVTKVEMSKPEISQMDNFALSWIANAKDVSGTPDALRGTSTGNSAEAFRAQAFQAQQAQSLFQLMTENKGLAIIDMMRTWILPYIRRTQLSNSDEIAATLTDYDIKRIDSAYIKNAVIQMTNKQTLDLIGKNIKRIKAGQPIQPIDQQGMMDQNTSSLTTAMGNLGGQRFFKPSDLDDKEWGEQLADLEWELDIDVTGESEDVASMLTALNNSLALVVNPGFANNPRAQAIVGRVLELTGAMSPIEYNSIPSGPTPTATPTPTGALPPTQPSNQLPVGGL